MGKERVVDKDLAYQILKEGLFDKYNIDVIDNNLFDILEAGAEGNHAALEYLKLSEDIENVLLAIQEETTNSSDIDDSSEDEEDTPENQCGKSYTEDNLNKILAYLKNNSSEEIYRIDTSIDYELSDYMMFLEYINDFFLINTIHDCKQILDAIIDTQKDVDQKFSGLSYDDYVVWIDFGMDIKKGSIVSDIYIGPKIIDDTLKSDEINENKYEDDDTLDHRLEYANALGIKAIQLVSHDPDCILSTIRKLGVEDWTQDAVDIFDLFDIDPMLLSKD